jgi:Effector protein
MPSDTATRWDGIIIRLRSEDESAMFPAIVKEALNKIASKPVGRSLLEDIAALANKKKFGYTVAIMRPGGLSIVNNGQGPQWSSGSVAKRSNENDACNGAGTVSQLIWNANSLSTPSGARPPFIGLAHELVHCLYALKGEGYIATMEEENRTVGLGELADARAHTENKIRAEHDIPLREVY